MSKLCDCKGVILNGVCTVCGRNVAETMVRNACTEIQKHAKQEKMSERRAIGWLRRLAGRGSRVSIELWPIGGRVMYVVVLQVRFVSLTNVDGCPEHFLVLVSDPCSCLREAVEVVGLWYSDYLDQVVAARSGPVIEGPGEGKDHEP